MRDSKRDTDIKNRVLVSVGGGEGGMIWENSVETCILPYRWPVQVWCMKQGTQNLCNVLHNPEGWDGEEVGGQFKMGGHMYTHGWFMSMYSKAPTIL